MASYLTVTEFKLRSIMPQADVDALELREPGFLAETIADWSEEIDARLRKRYVAPFSSPYPRTIIRWLVKLVTRDAYEKRGLDPSSASDEKAIYGAAETAEAELKEAADSEKGLFDLPLRADDSTSGVVNGGPLGYTEQSPYTWATLQKRAAIEEES
jgi:hypothetical protein